MTRWQRRVRLGLATVGVVVAGAVYTGLRERAPAVPPPPVERIDPEAVAETTGGHFLQVRGSDVLFTVTWDKGLTYKDGSNRLIGVRISVSRDDGRDYIITAREGQERERRDLQLTGEVTLTASDGFSLATDHALFDLDSAVVHAPGDVTFQKGSLTGSGVGATYHERDDMLQVSDQTRVRVADGQGGTSTEFTATAATLDRPGGRLTLGGGVRALRDGRILEAHRANAHLSPPDGTITFIELRGEASVSGGAGALGSMTAREIDLDYTEDGEQLERVALRGSAAIAVGGEGGGPGRRLSGESFDLRPAPDGSLERASGDGGVQLDLPGTSDAPPGVVRARTFTGSGTAGEGLTAARFDGDAEYIEGPPDRPRRSARAQSLQLGLGSGGVGSADMTGDVVFEGDGYHATAGSARYRPDAGTLRLERGGAADDPRVSDDRMAIDAPAIDLDLATQRIQARGGVTPVRTAIGAAREGDWSGLLRQDEPAHVTAAALDYDGASALAVYTGEAVLWQDETALRADRIAIDRPHGHLVATGSARLAAALETGRLDGRAHEIAYDDAGRVLTYTVSPDRRGGGPAGVRDLAQLSGPAGDLQARHITVRLSSGGGRVERIEAEADVHVQTGARTATGTRLVYAAADERYDLTGTIAAPVRVTEACDVTEGRALIFFASTDRIIVDGHEQVRTRTTSRESCRDSRRR